ncbi:MAG: hypothetical protein BZY80_07125 [SAR202 cluster bacterium Io17-Chloro-G2]|nr:MAG: hypothetical protein BZY80_07125 [SAR202 cluster bacterium Io17-Chloro-G2]
MFDALAGVTVLEYAGFVSGPYCGKLLAEMGATVLKVEEPVRGDPARRYGPFPSGIPHREKSGLFLFLNTNKQSVTLNPTSPTGRDLFLRLAAKTIILIEDRRPGEMAEMGLDYPKLKESNPGLVQVSITPYGQDGPKASWKANHINTFHASGEGYTLPGGMTNALFPERGPVAGGVHLGEYDAGLMAASAAVAALLAREASGAGQQVDISKQEAIMGLSRLGMAQSMGQGIVYDRSRSYEYGGIFGCRDGYVILYPREDSQWKALAEIMGRPELAEDARFRTRPARIENGAAINLVLSEWASGQGKEEIYYQVAPSGCPTAFFSTPENAHHSPQFEAREFFEDVTHPMAGTLRHPGRPYRFGAGGRPDTKPAPTLGQHNEKILCGELGLAPQELSRLGRGGTI